jgi:hypothetical protein
VNLATIVNFRLNQSNSGRWCFVADAFASSSRCGSNKRFWRERLVARLASD